MEDEDSLLLGNELYNNPFLICCYNILINQLYHATIPFRVFALVVGGVYIYREREILNRRL